MTALTASVLSAPSAAPATGSASLVQSVDWLAITPVVLPAAVALVVLVADLFLPERRKPLLGWLSVAGLAAATATLLPLRAGDRATFCLTTDPGACSYTADHFTLVIQFLVLAGALVTALLSVTAVRDARMPAGEYWFLLLSSTAGAALLPASRDLATLIVALEVASLPAFALVGMRRGDRLSSEAALKFFLSSVTATAVSLLGVSFVYAATGSCTSRRSPTGSKTSPDSSTPSPWPGSRSPSSASPSRPQPSPSTSGSRTPTSARRCPSRATSP